MGKPYGIFANLDDFAKNPNDPNVAFDLIANLVLGGFLPKMHDSTKGEHGDHGEHGEDG